MAPETGPFNLYFLDRAHAASWDFAGRGSDAGWRHLHNETAALLVPDGFPGDGPRIDLPHTATCRRKCQNSGDVNVKTGELKLVETAVETAVEIDGRNKWRQVDN